MLNVVLILFNIVLYTLQTLLYKMFGDKYPGEKKYIAYVYSVFLGFSTVLISLIFGGFNIEFNPLTLLLGALNAVASFLYYLTVYYASKNGPYSVVMVFSIAGGISIPVLTSFIALGETPSVLKILCFAVIFVGAYFVTKKPSENMGIQNKKAFFIAVFSLAVVNGIYGGLINLQQAYTGEGQKDEMIMYTFLIAGIFSFVFLLIKKRGKVFLSFKQTRSSFLFMLGAALSSGFAINMLVIIAKYIDVNLLWTFNNSGVLVLSVIASALIFKEKLTVTNIVACGAIAVTLVAVSFV